MIRRIKESDINRVADIWLNTNIETHNFISSQYWLDNYKSVKETLVYAEIYVYEVANNIHGFIGLNGDYVEGIFVCHDGQSKGIGKQLLDYVKGIKNQLSLRVYQKNARAIKFYQREKFDISSENLEENTGEKEYLMTWRGKIKFD